MARRQQSPQPQPSDPPPAMNGEEVDPLVEEPEEDVEAEEERTDPGPTLHARLKKEEREDQERDAVDQIYDKIRASLDLQKYEYKFRLYRLRPEFFGGHRVDGLLKTYDDLPEIEDIQSEHGGEYFKLMVNGPDPKDPSKKKTTVVLLPRLHGPPKTKSTPEGALPLDQIPRPPQADPMTGVIDKMFTMVAKQMDDFQQNMKSQLAQVTSKPVMTVDPAVAEERREREAEKQRQHELMLKRMDKDAEDRREKDRREAEDRRDAEKERREADERREKERREDQKAIEAQRIRDHEKEMKRIEVESARHATEAEANRKEAERRHNEMVAAMKDNKKDDNPEERILTVLALVDRIRGDDKKDESAGIREAVATSIVKLPDKIESLMTKWMSVKDAKPAAKKEAARGSYKPDTVGVVDVEATPVAEPELKFEWPTDTTEIPETIKMLGRNVEKALAARWLSQRIFDEVVKKFPENIRDLMRVTGTDEIQKNLEEHADEGAVLRSPRGKAAVRMLHGLLRREKQLEKAAEAKPQEQPKGETSATQTAE